MLDVRSVYTKQSTLRSMEPNSIYGNFVGLWSVCNINMQQGVWLLPIGIQTHLFTFEMEYYGQGKSQGQQQPVFYIQHWLHKIVFECNQLFH